MVKYLSYKSDCCTVIQRLYIELRDEGISEHNVLLFQKCSTPYKILRIFGLFQLFFRSNHSEACLVSKILQHASLHGYAPSPDLKFNDECDRSLAASWSCMADKDCCAVCWLSPASQGSLFCRYFGGTGGEDGRLHEGSV
jgi:hypothetical protein